MATQQLHPYYELLPSYIAPESIRSERDELLQKAQVRPFLMYLFFITTRWMHLLMIMVILYVCVGNA